MKRTLLAVALVATAAMSADIKYGIGAQGLLVMPSLDNGDATLGFGGAVIGDARIVVADKMSVRPFAGFEYSTSGQEYPSFWGEGKTTLTVTSMFLPVGAAFEYEVLPKLSLSVAPEFDVSLGGTWKIETPSYSESFFGTTVTVPATSVEEDISGQSSPFLIGGGVSYAISDNISVNAGYKFAVTEYFAGYKLNKVYVGGRYEI